MKAVLEAHWEKGVASLALLLCVLSGVRNLALVSAPPFVEEVREEASKIRSIMDNRPAPA